MFARYSTTGVVVVADVVIVVVVVVVVYPQCRAELCLPQSL